MPSVFINCQRRGIAGPTAFFKAFSEAYAVRPLFVGAVDANGNALPVAQVSEAVKGYAFEALSRLDRNVGLTPPDGSKAVGGWLASIQTLDLALKTIGTLSSEDFPWADEFTERLDSAVSARVEEATKLPDAWRFGRQAEEAVAQYGAGLRPWDKLDTRLKEDDASGDRHDKDAVAKAWIDRRLDEKSENLLVGFVAQDGPWRSAYRRQLQTCLPRLDFEDVNPNFFYGPIDTMALPHLGRGARLKFVLMGRRVVCDFWPGVGERPNLDHGSSVLRPGRKVDVKVKGDEVTGPLKTTAVAWPVNALEECKFAVDCLRKAADLESHNPDWSETVALGVVELMLGDKWTEAMKVLNEDDEPAEGQELWAELAVTAAPRIEHIASETASEELYDKLEMLNGRYKKFEDAVLVLEKKMYDEITEGYPMRSDLWWGVHARLENAVKQLPDDLLKKAAAAGMGEISQIGDELSKELGEIEIPVDLLTTENMALLQSALASKGFEIQMARGGDLLAKITDEEGEIVARLVEKNGTFYFKDEGKGRSDGCSETYADAIEEIKRRPRGGEVAEAEGPEADHAAVGIITLTLLVAVGSLGKRKQIRRKRYNQYGGMKTEHPSFEEPLDGLPLSSKDAIIRFEYHRQDQEYRVHVFEMGQKELRRLSLEITFTDGTEEHFDGDLLCSAGCWKVSVAQRYVADFKVIYEGK